MHILILFATYTTLHSATGSEMFFLFIYSFFYSVSIFFLIMAFLDPYMIPGSLSLRREYTPDGMPDHYAHVHSHLESI